MTSSDQEALRRLGDAVLQRRVDLQLSQDGVGLHGGTSDVTLRNLELGEGRPPRRTTLVKLDRALRWGEGTAAAIYEGRASLEWEDDFDEDGVQTAHTPVIVERMPHGEGVTYLTQGPRALGEMGDFDPDVAGPPSTPESIEAAYETWAGRLPLYEQSTPDLLTELAGRYRALEGRVRELEQERDRLAAEVERRAKQHPAPAPLTPDEDHVAEWAENDQEHEEQWKAGTPDRSAYGLAAKHGHSKMERLDREAEERGEESQDPGTDEPA